MLTATFVRRRGQRDHVYVERSDGTSVHWAFPSYGDGLPHDLCHLVVEDALGLPDGFWGLVDRHVDVRLVDNQATLVRHGRPLAGEPGIDLSGLRQAEEAVAQLASPFCDTEAADTEAANTEAAGTDVPGETVTAVTDRLQELGRQWRALDDGSALVAVFSVNRP